MATTHPPTTTDKVKRSFGTVDGVGESLGLAPFDDIELVDAARGREECIRFFGAFEEFYTRLRDDVLAAHARAGEATIPEITEELRAIGEPAVNQRKKMKFQRIPRRLDVMVAVVLKETGAVSRRETRRVLFTCGKHRSAIPDLAFCPAPG